MPLLFGPGGRALGQPADAFRPTLAREQLARLRKAARDSALDPWQREAVRSLAFDLAAGPSRLAASSGKANAEDGTWRRIPSPSQRASHAAIYDPVRDRMIMFGGEDWWGGSRYNDVWALPLGGTPTWSLLEPAGTPPGERHAHTAFHDPVRDRMIVFGGVAAQGLVNEVWALSLAGTPAWTQLAPAGTPPSARCLHTAIHDPVRDRMIVFGGVAAQGLMDEVWTLSLVGSPTWTRLAPAGPSPRPRAWHTAIYDPLRDRMVVFGGSAGGDQRNDVWALSLGGIPTWAQLEPTNTPPDGRLSHTAIYDRVRDRMMVFGGQDGFARADVWALSLEGTPAWTEIPPAGARPIGRSRQTAIYDPVRDQMVTFGGEDWDAISLGDTWTLTLGGTSIWTKLWPVGTPPNERHGHAAIYDPVRGRILVHGGRSDGYPGEYDDGDVWVLSSEGDPTWTQLGAAGAPPNERHGHSAIYDPVRERMVVFAGGDCCGGSFDDVWALWLSGTPTWTPLAPAGTSPGPRRGHTATYDPVRNRMVVFGGGLRNDVWVLSLDGTPTWTELLPTGTPPSARWAHTAVYDPVHDRIIVFGGQVSHDTRSNDVWELSLDGTPTWTQLAPAGTPPSARSEHTAIYDPARDRMVVFGGYWERTDVWALSLSGIPTWTELAPADGPSRGRCGHTAIYERTRDRVVAFGGSDCDLVSWNDVWTLTWDRPLFPPTATEPLVRMPERSVLYRPQPHPFRPGGRIAFDLAQRTEIQLRIYDLGGRLVKTLVDGPMPAGRHEIPWTGAVASGVYYLEMRSDAFRQGQRLVVMR